MSTPPREPSHQKSACPKLHPRRATPLLAALLLTLTGCIAGNPNPTAIALTGPPATTLDPGTSASLAAFVIGGPLNAGVLWTLAPCPLAPCGTLSNATTASVTYTAPATVPAPLTVTIIASAFADAALRQTLTLTIPTNLALTPLPGPLPAANFATPYAQPLTATGGIPPYTWTLTQGALPTGLSLSSTTGAITGTPTVGGTATFTVKLTDSGQPSPTPTAAYTLATALPAGEFQGQVLSGTTPIPNATLQLYAAGLTGNASAATPMLTQPVLSNANGVFKLNGLYTCGRSATGIAIPPTAQLYLVATSNALTFVTAIGPCANFTPSSFTTLNELTTAAAAWALAPFAASATNIGASATNTLGITNAFLDAALLANPTTGTPATLPTNLTVETPKLSALADALSTCATTSCTALVTAATVGTSIPTNTFTAALNIVHRPGQNVAAVFATLPATPPFLPTLTASPNDWTLALTITGGGLSMPTALGIDTYNNVWVANQNGPLSAFSAQGTSLSSTGFAAGNISQTYGLAIDTANNIWVTNYNGYGSGSVTEIFGVTNPATTGTSAIYANSICYPTAAAADTNGNLFIANEECSSATVLNNAGTPIAPYLGESLGLAARPNFLAVDTTHGLWLSDNDSTIAHISAPSTTYPNGQLLAHPTCCYDSRGLATDNQGNVWIANYSNSSISEVAPDGTVLLNQQIVSNGTATPYAVVVDAAQNIWLTSLDSASFLELSGATTTHPGTELSPSTGAHGHGGFGQDANLLQPYSLAPDRSGNLWISNNAQNSLVMFFGLAAPTLTPLQPTPTAP